jgi:hypothetical protein
MVLPVRPFKKICIEAGSAVLTGLGTTDEDEEEEEDGAAADGSASSAAASSLRPRFPSTLDDGAPATDDDDAEEEDEEAPPAPPTALVVAARKDDTADPTVSTTVDDPAPAAARLRVSIGSEGGAAALEVRRGMADVCVWWAGGAAIGRAIAREGGGEEEMWGGQVDIDHDQMMQWGAAGPARIADRSHRPPYISPPASPRLAVCSQPPQLSRP